MIKLVVVGRSFLGLFSLKIVIAGSYLRQVSTGINLVLQELLCKVFDLCILMVFVCNVCIVHESLRIMPCAVWVDQLRRAPQGLDAYGFGNILAVRRRNFDTSMKCYLLYRNSGIIFDVINFDKNAARKFSFLPF